MNKLMMTVAATMAFAAFADEPAAPAEACPAPALAEKAMRPNRPPMMMGAGAMDPLVRAVMSPKFAEKIGLSDEQKAKIAEFRSEKADDRALQEKVRTGMHKQAELLKAEKIDEASVMQAIDEVFEARKEMAKAQTKRMIAVRSILTPDQVSKALEAMKEMRGPRPNRPGFKGGVPKEVTPQADIKKCSEPKCDAAK